MRLPIAEGQHIVVRIVFTLANDGVDVVSARGGPIQEHPALERERGAQLESGVVRDLDVVVVTIEVQSAAGDAGPGKCTADRAVVPVRRAIVGIAIQVPHTRKVAVPHGCGILRIRGTGIPVVDRNRGRRARIDLRHLDPDVVRTGLVPGAFDLVLELRAAVCCDEAQIGAVVVGLGVVDIDPVLEFDQDREVGEGLGTRAVVEGDLAAIVPIGIPPAGQRGERCILRRAVAVVGGDGIGITGGGNDDVDGCGIGVAVTVIHGVGERVTRSRAAVVRVGEAAIRVQRDGTVRRLRVTRDGERIPVDVAIVDGHTSAGGHYQRSALDHGEILKARAVELGDLLCRQLAAENGDLVDTAVEPLLDDIQGSGRAAPGVGAQHNGLTVAIDAARVSVGSVSGL